MKRTREGNGTASVASQRGRSSASSLSDDPPASPLTVRSSSNATNELFCLNGDIDVATHGCGGGGSDVIQPTAPVIASGANMVDGESLLARELSTLSVQDRENVYEDIHGVRQPTEETESLKRTCLQRLETALKSIPLFSVKESTSADQQQGWQNQTNSARAPTYSNEMKRSYGMAAFLVPRITSDEHLRLVILRASHWNIKKSVAMLLKYFRVKERLFGKEKYLRPITFSDLQDDAQDSLKSGAILFHDANYGLSRRSIILDVYQKWNFQSTLSHAQAYWYMSYVVNRSLRAQREGVVVVSYTLGATIAHLSKALELAKLGFADAMPIRVAGIHLCTSDSRLKSLLGVVMAALPGDVRLRSKLHCGSPIECNYELLAYGIPSHALPMDEFGTFVDGSNASSFAIDNTIACCLERDEEVLKLFYGEKIDPATKICTATSPPRQNDVLFGRGRSYQEFPGNKRFIDLLRASKSAYDQMKKNEKTQITIRLVNDIKASGVRFMKRNGKDWWEEVDDSVARQRVAMSFRNLSRGMN